MRYLNHNISDEKVLIDDQKASVDRKKALIESQEASIADAINAMDANKNTKENARKLYAYMRSDGVFGRKDIMEINEVGVTAAGNLLNALKAADLIIPVVGFGKGKYRFKTPSE